MPSLFTLQGLDNTLNNMDLNPGTLRAELIGIIRGYFPDDASLRNIGSIPTDELVLKLWGPCSDKELKAKRKNFSNLKSTINKSLKELDKTGKNPGGIILGRDNVFIVSEERKDHLLKQLGLSADSPHLFGDMLEALKQLFSETEKGRNRNEIKGLLLELESARKMLEEMAGIGGQEESLPGEYPNDEEAETVAVEEIELAEEEELQFLDNGGPGGDVPGGIEPGQAGDAVELLTEEIALAEDEELQFLDNGGPGEDVPGGIEPGPTGDAVELLTEEIALAEDEELQFLDNGGPGGDVPGEPLPLPGVLEVLSQYIDSNEALNEERELLRETREEFIQQVLERFMPKFIKIPAGTYTVGSNRPAPIEGNEKKVALQGFYLGQTPVTNDLFDLFIRETGYMTDAEKAGYGIVFEGRCTSHVDQESGGKILTLRHGTTASHVSGADWRHPSGPGSRLEGKHHHPVVQVSHNDARAFAAWAGKRLPLEEEWEAAARGLEGLLFPWGNTWQAELGNFASSCLGATTPVDHGGRAAMSPFGICDLLGNVAEWTATLYQKESGDLPAEKLYLLKGGSWASEGIITAAHRQIEKGHYWANTIGFRCAV